MRRSFLLVLLALLLAAVPLPTAARPLAQAGTATLSIIANPVEVQAVGAAGYAPASDAQTLSVGSRVRTGADGRAVLTFFDGTTAALDAGTELTLERVQPSGEQSGGLLVGVGLTAGRVWTQVSSLLNRGSSFEVQAAAATAVAREGVTGFAIDGQGNLWCWAIAGEPLRIRTAGAEVTLADGQEAGFAPAGVTEPRSERGELGVVRPRAFGKGLLEVRSEGAAQVRLVTPRGFTVGFPLADLVVNQVQDATTSPSAGPSRWLRLPGPAAGQYRLVLQPTDDGPYRVQVELSLDGRELFAQDLAGVAQAGQLLIADLTINALNGLPASAQLGAPRTLAGPAPGNFVYPRAS
jgi:hypothetical protein